MTPKQRPVPRSLSLPQMDANRRTTFSFFSFLPLLFGLLTFTFFLERFDRFQIYNDIDIMGRKKRSSRSDDSGREGMQTYVCVYVGSFGALPADDQSRGY